MKRLAVLLVLVGCAKSGIDHEESLARASDFRKRGCACADKKCAQGVIDEMYDWGRASYKKHGDKDQAPPELQEKILAEIAALSACYEKAPR